MKAKTIVRRYPKSLISSSIQARSSKASPRSAEGPGDTRQWVPSSKKRGKGRDSKAAVTAAASRKQLFGGNANSGDKYPRAAVGEGKRRKNLDQYPGGFK